jgi:chaperone required for assembly of F1-ATPase
MRPAISARRGNHLRAMGTAQRPQRFYQNVQVVPVEPDRVLEVFRKKTRHAPADAMDVPRLLLPRPPSPQLVPMEQEEKEDADSQQRNRDRTITWHTVLLDEKPLRTPSGKPLYIPSLDLAHGIATEWNAVPDHVIPPQMPLMTLTCTVWDQVLLSTPQDAATFRTQCLQYLMTDTVCYYADPQEERPLYQQQKKTWRRLHEWIATSFLPPHWPPPAIHVCHSNARPGTVDPLVRVLPHAPELRAAVEQWIARLDAWHLVALYVACKETKSFLLGAALVLGAPGADIAWVQTAARVEEEWNIRAWGLVEGQHDYDRLNAAIQLRAVAWMVHCL